MNMTPETRFVEWTRTPPEEASPVQRRPRGGRHGEDRAQYWPRAEAGEAVDRAEDEGGDHRTVPHGAEAGGDEGEAATRYLEDAEEYYDEAGDEDEGRPVAVDEPADGREPHPQGHERHREPHVEDGGPPRELVARLEGVGEERRQEQRAARGEQREQPAQEGGQEAYLNHPRPPSRPPLWPPRRSLAAAGRRGPCR